MVVWDAGSRVDGATQGGRLQLASLFHGTDHPTKEGKTTGSSSPAPRVRTCLPLHDTLASDRATQGFLTRSLSHHFLMSSDTFWHGEPYRGLRPRASVPRDGPPLFEESNEWSI
jgi:hypothetical protein